MRRRLAPICAALWTLAAAASAQDSSPAFSATRASPQGQLILEATAGFASSGPERQEAKVREALIRWRESRRAEGSEDPEPYALVVTPAGGSLWRLTKDRASLVEEWVDAGPPRVQAAPSQARYFAFFGGQQTTGRDVDISGWNARLGSTLLKNRYDLAAVYNHNSNNAAPKTTTSSYGLVARHLFPVTPGFGLNLGVQVLRNSGTSTPADTATSAVGGISFFFSGGSFDVTYTSGDDQSRSLLAGFTLYLSPP